MWPRCPHFYYYWKEHSGECSCFPSIPTATIALFKYLNLNKILVECFFPTHSQTNTDALDQLHFHFSTNSIGQLQFRLIMFRSTPMLMVGSFFTFSFPPTQLIIEQLQFWKVLFFTFTFPPIMSFGWFTFPCKYFPPQWSKVRMLNLCWSQFLSLWSLWPLWSWGSS